MLLDLAGFSPGVIDGKFGSNVDKAIIAYRRLLRQAIESGRYRQPLEPGVDIERGVAFRICLAGGAQARSRWHDSGGHGPGGSGSP